MADHYTQFSFLLPIDEEANVTEEKIEEWLGLLGEDRELQHFHPDERDEMEVWEEIKDYFEMELIEEGVWVHAEDGGEPQAAVMLTRDFMRRFHPDSKGICIGWAHVCSRPIIDAYGGGATVVTAEQVFEVASYDAVGKANEAGVEVYS